jgi:antitoxin component YwqK of YwqJK toxin-antitoxin module
MKTHLLLLTILLAVIYHASGKEPERMKAAGGQTIIKAFYDDGTINTVTRLNPDGSLLGILHHTAKGVPTRADYYDDHKRVRRTLYYRPDGTPKSAKEFDEHGKTVSQQEFDAAGNVKKGHKVEMTATSRLTMRWSERRTAVRSTFEMIFTL